MGKFLDLFIIFFLYSVFGYLCECIYCSIKCKKIITNRGFLLGPYLPIYGFGALVIVFLLQKYIHDPIALFVMAFFSCTILEYITSFIMEKVFKARWWDYSKKKLNINGRVCLENSFLFGVGGLGLMYLVNPFLEGIMDTLNNSLFIVISYIIMILFFIDVFVSIVIAYKLRENSITIKELPDEELNKQTIDKLSKGIYLKKRLLNAFPDIKKTKTYIVLNDIFKKKVK